MAFVKNTRLNTVNFVKKERQDACFTHFYQVHLTNRINFLYL